MDYEWDILSGIYQQFAMENGYGNDVNFPINCMVIFQFAI